MLQASVPMRFKGFLEIAGQGKHAKDLRVGVRACVVLGLTGVTCW